MTTTLTLDGRSLVATDLAPLYRGEPLRLQISPEAMEAVRRARKVVDDHVEAGNVVYGLTTGFGKLKSVAIAEEDLGTLQRNLVLSHCCGVGDPMPPEEVRVVQVLRLNGLVRGHSGVRAELVESLVRIFNAGLIPVVPQQGSVGASGDLAPLAQVAATYLGYGEAWVGGERMSGRAAMDAIGEAPLELAAKEGLALINGTEVIKAIGLGVYLRACNLSKVADILVACTLEALFGSVKPFDPRLAELKGHAGHARTSSNVRALMQGSQILASHADCDRVQDPYSLRCVPQVHGAFKSCLEHVGQIFGHELNAVTDNPVLFPETGEVISAGQFHGHPLSMALDYLTIGLASLSNISERRTEQLVNPDLSGLPPFLAANPGLDSGLMIAQVAAAALASENKVHSHPASVDTVPTSANQEDHVSMGVTAARKARSVVENSEYILGIEYLCGYHGRGFHPELTPSAAVAAAHVMLGQRVPPLTEDRYQQDDLRAARDLVANGSLVEAAETAAGELAC